MRISDWSSDVCSSDLFARSQQFASSVYGPPFASGLAYWLEGDSNYGGHNAIIRVKPFVEHCGLPVLPGREPFGGEILSHDFVEEALLRRAGWEVWLEDDLGSSFEATPPTLIDNAKRDRRWCQHRKRDVSGRVVKVRVVHGGRTTIKK